MPDIGSTDNYASHLRNLFVHIIRIIALEAQIDRDFTSFSFLIYYVYYYDIN